MRGALQCKKDDIEKPKHRSAAVPCQKVPFQSSGTSMNLIVPPDTLIQNQASFEIFGLPTEQLDHSEIQHQPAAIASDGKLVQNSGSLESFSCAHTTEIYDCACGPSIVY